MSGFTKIKKGSIELEHFSTASLIKLTFTSQEQKNEQGDMEEVVSVEWFDYSQFADLKKAVNETDEWL